MSEFQLTAAPEHDGVTICRRTTALIQPPITDQMGRKRQKDNMVQDAPPTFFLNFKAGGNLILFVPWEYSGPHFCNTNYAEAISRANILTGKDIPDFRRYSSLRNFSLQPLQPSK